MKEILNMPTGRLSVHVTTASEMLPIQGAIVITKDKGGRVLFNQITDANGMTDYIDLTAPDASTTLNPSTAPDSYSTYDVEITHPGFQTVTVHNVEILAGVTSYLPVSMHPSVLGRRTFMGDPPQTINIPSRYDPPPSGDQTTVENVGDNFDDVNIPPPAVTLLNQSGRIGSNAQIPVRQVFVPTSITVHLGTPQNATARNVRVPFAEYVANVASSEIFATWPEASLRANIHAITTFALNRLYTEWYRSRGFNFDITNTTQFDQMYVHGRNIFTNLMQIAQEVINQYVRRIGFANPLFTTYRANACGTGCLSQWGTVDLANRGFTPLQIIRNFYGQDTEIATTHLVQDISSTYPGTPMRLGSPQSRYIQLMQQHLNRIRQNFPLIPRILSENGVFGPDTDAAVRQFQRTFNLPVDGVIGPATWNRITQTWVAVTNLAAINSEGVRVGIGATPPNVVLRSGSSGNDVRQLQWLLSYIGQYYEFIPQLTVDGRFGPMTDNSVREFQRNFGLAVDGVVGPATWNRLYEVFRRIQNTSPNPAPVPPPTPPTPPPSGTFTGVVTTAGGNLNLRSAPSLNSSIIATVPNGTRLTILGEQNGFYRVRTPQGQEGWVSGDFLRPTQTTGAVVTQGGNLNFRSAPSTTAPIIGSIPNGTPVTILDIAGNFYRINWNGREGFVSRDFVRI